MIASPDLYGKKMSNKSETRDYKNSNKSNGMSHYHKVYLRYEIGGILIIALCRYDRATKHDPINAMEMNT